eukprot:755689-Hanusia_phi.AAC.1
MDRTHPLDPSDPPTPGISDPGGPIGDLALGNFRGRGSIGNLRGNKFIMRLCAFIRSAAPNWQGQEVVGAHRMAGGRSIVAYRLDHLHEMRSETRSTRMTEHTTF